MADNARAYDGGRPHGTMAEEAVKLAEVAQLWLASRAHRAGAHPGDDVWAEATAEPGGEPPECTGCPICRVRRAVAGVNPEVYDHLADAVASLAAALRALATDPDRP